MTVKHTPGPWGDSKKTVLVRGLNFLSHANYQTEVGSANARLIASAPDLLDALIEAREFIDRYSDVVDGSYGEPEPNRAMALVSTIDAALSKAGASQ